MPQEVPLLNTRLSTGAHRSIAASVALAAALTLGACESNSGNDSKSKAEKANSGASVVAPGKPGEPAKTLTPDQAAKAVPEDTPNDADFAYAQMMIEHHGQALTMTGLVPDRASSTQVKRVAARISAAQGPEITAMEGWLKNNGADKRKGGGHDHGSMAMPGMATDAQLKQLRAAKGKAFDELFLKLMITHHEGAVAMAADAVSDGNNILIQEMANDVISQQTSEIGRMRKM
ncbi:DUF305 domain-containing protein [Streptomyces sp. NPDC051018]|uniref:DUF305 domain-containing protein n=1 Tax=Streptomyces sp. NPDC051018 TaxID=3365639 RepID=UPI0037B782C9